MDEYGKKHQIPVRESDESAKEVGDFDRQNNNGGDTAKEKSHIVASVMDQKLKPHKSAADNERTNKCKVM